ncbi:MAG TPA: hypothetical protein VFI31_10335 [Pirellulales bacterium]|nr:hypothetical protein [Pirellulales bacterium]
MKLAEAKQDAVMRRAAKATTRVGEKQPAIKGEVIHAQPVKVGDSSASPMK